MPTDVPAPKRVRLSEGLLMKTKLVIFKVALVNKDFYHLCPEEIQEKKTSEILPSTLGGNFYKHITVRS